MFDSIKVWWESKIVVPQYDELIPISALVSEPILTIGELFRDNPRRFKIKDVSDVGGITMIYLLEGNEMTEYGIHITDNETGVKFMMTLQSSANLGLSNTDTVSVSCFSYGDYTIYQGSAEADYLSGLCRDHIKRILKVREYKVMVRRRDISTRINLAIKKDKSTLMSLYCKEGI